MRFSLSKLLSDLSADATMVGFDMRGGVYDRMHKLLERTVTLPDGKAGRTTLIALMLTASRLVKQQLGPMGPLANFVNEIVEDGVREEAKRILEAANQKVATAKQLNDSPTGLDAIWEMDDSARAKLLEQYRQLDSAGQQHMREQMLRATVSELAILAGMSREDLETILSMMTPKPTTPIKESVRSGLETLTAQLNRWAGR